MKRATFLLATAILVAAALTARADTVTIPAARDNTLFLDPGGLVSGGASPGIFAGKNSQANTRRALIYFDVTAAIPVPAVIDSVELRLNVESAPNETPQPVTVHRVLASWGEGASYSTGGAGAPSATGDATWLHRFYPSTYWTTVGGHFDATSHATTVAGPTGWHVWTNAALVQDVIDWLASPSDNHGWLMRGNENEASTVRRFYSRETENGPELVIYYTPIPTASHPVTWGRIKTFYR